MDLGNEPKCAPQRRPACSTTPVLQGFYSDTHQCQVVWQRTTPTGRLLPRSPTMKIFKRSAVHLEIQEARAEKRSTSEAFACRAREQTTSWNEWIRR
jgi:hypothetical protein